MMTMSTIVVTGGSSGLGKAIVTALLACDWPVADWSLETGVDVTDRVQVIEAAGKLLAVDILINCAGVNHLDHIENLTKPDWDRVMGVNAWAILNCTQALLPHLQAGGTVLNILSSAAQQPMTLSLLYNASKAAAAMMTRQMARELGNSHHITVFGISPGWLDGTGMTKLVDKRLKEMRDLNPPEHRIDPTRIADMIAWLLGRKERHEYLHGSILEYGV